MTLETRAARHVPTEVEALDVLGLGRGADRDAIRAAFWRRLECLRTNPSATAEEVVEGELAYSVLTGRLAPAR